MAGYGMFLGILTFVMHGENWSWSNWLAVEPHHPAGPDTN